MFLLCIIMFVACEPKEEEPENTSAYITEFTVNGKTYNIGTTGYSTKINALFTVDGQKGNLEMNFPDDLKLSTYKFTDGYILIGHESFSGSFQAVYDKVDVTISKIGTATSYGTANIQGAFSGTFLYMETDSNGVLNGGGEVQLSGKFSTEP